jgi:hypothetical protein
LNSRSIKGVRFTCCFNYASTVHSHPSFSGQRSTSASFSEFQTKRPGAIRRTFKFQLPQSDLERWTINAGNDTRTKRTSARNSNQLKSAFLVWSWALFSCTSSPVAFGRNYTEIPPLYVTNHR